MTRKNWISIFALLFALIIEIVTLFLFDAPGWAGFMIFFIAMMYFRMVFD